MDWWNEVELADGVRLACVPAQHWSGRGACDRARSLWCGFVLTGPAGVVYFAGDTGDGPHFELIREKFGPPRLAILPIGAYLPEWFMAPVHLSPAEAVRAHINLGATTSMGIHYGTFQLSDEGQDEPLEELARSLEAQKLTGSDFWALDFGEGRDVPRSSDEKGHV